MLAYLTHSCFSQRDILIEFDSDEDRRRNESSHIYDAETKECVESNFKDY